MSQLRLCSPYLQTQTINANNLKIDTLSMGDVLDEDDMASNSSSSLATQQSIKAYVDSITPSDLFLAKTSGASTNSSGDGTEYTVLFDTETYDTGSNYVPGTGTYTVPSTGYYTFTFYASVNNLSAANHTSVTLGLAINGTTTYTLFKNNVATAVTDLSGNGSITVS
jgi:hypothetical protein